MDVKTIPPMKPVLVTDVSDNINVLQKDDVTKQRTVVTARALEDIFKCAPFRKTNAFDVGYYSDDKIDLDLVVTAQSRSLEANGYLHGPTVIHDAVASGTDSKWSANHSKYPIVSDGYLYVFSVLDDNVLTWDHDENPISIEDQADVDEDIAYRKVDPRIKSQKIRQIFVACRNNEYLTFDGTKDPTTQAYERAHRSRHDIAAPWTRMGTLKEDGTYKWEDWYILGKTHNGPEYFQNIIITNDNVTITNPLVDAVYHIYGEGVKMTLPNVNLDGYKLGQKLIVEVHPVEGKSPSCQVTYEDTTATGAHLDDLTLTLTPRIRRNTKDVFGEVRSDANITSTAVFEVCKRVEGNQTFNTWELDAGVEETDFTAGLAQQLGEHTDLVAWDIVNFQEDYWGDKKVVDVIYPVTSSGYVVADFLKTANVSFNWFAQVYIADLPTSLERASSITAGQEYWFRDVNKWVKVTAIAGDTRDLYTLTETNKGYDVLTHEYKTDLSMRSKLNQVDISLNKKRRFLEYARRGSIIHVHLESSGNMSNFKGHMFPVVSFHPDQHDSYVQKVAINQTAFTGRQLRKLFDDGSIVGDIQVSNDDELYKGVLNSPSASNALINAYTYLASKLQSKGLLLGEVIAGNNSNIDSFTNPGCFYFVPNIRVQGVPPSSKSDEGFNLVVFSGSAPGGIIHEEEGGLASTNTIVQVALLPDPLLENPSQTDLNSRLLNIEVRVGTRFNGNVHWGPWIDITNTEWNRIRNKPKYFHSRWDYVEDPNTIISFVDTTAARAVVTDPITGNEILKQTCSGVTPASGTATYTCDIPSEFFAYLLRALEETNDENSDVRRTDNISYKVPCVMVGIAGLNAGTALSDKSNDQAAQYVFHLHFPDASRYSSDTARASVTKRRKIRVMFYGTPALLSSLGWNELQLKVTYQNADRNSQYSYVRTWGTNSPIPGSGINQTDSIMIIDFEQMLLPTGELIWSPLEIG